MVVLDRGVQAGGEGARTAFREATLAVVEAVSLRISPEVGDELGVIEGVLVQPGERGSCLIAGGRGTGERSAKAQGPDLILIQRRGITPIGSEGQTRFPGIDGDGVQDAVGVIPLGLTDGLHVNVSVEIEHEVGEFLPVVPGPAPAEGNVGIRFQIDVAQAQAGRVGDVQHRLHPGGGRAQTVTGERERKPVVSLAVLEAERRRDEPVPNVFAGDAYDPVALGPGLIAEADHACAEGNPTVFAEFILSRHVIFLLQLGFMDL